MSTTIVVQLSGKLLFHTIKESVVCDGKSTSERLTINGTSRRSLGLESSYQGLHLLTMRSLPNHTRCETG